MLKNLSRFLPALVFRGLFTYRRSAGGTLTLEGAPFDGGRLTEAGPRYHVTDHLGSVRAVWDGTVSATSYPLAGFYSMDDYAPYGVKSASGAASSITLKPTGATVSLRDGFTGQEDQGPDFSVPYLDFGARQYSPSLSRWLVPDPMGEKYYDVSPYAYCAGNPVSLVDPEGKDIVPRQLAESLGTIPNYQYSRLLDDNYGPYSVYAYYDSNDNIVGYGATKDVRHGQNSISRFDYIMTSESDLSLFSDNVSLYSIAADIFNANHEPTPGELNIISGHILKGLVMEWREALSNPIYWLNTISILGISCLSLQSSLTIEQVINKSTPCGRAKNGWRIRTRDGNLMDDYISLSKTYNGSFKESNGYNSFYTQDFVVGYHKSTSTGIPTLDINSKTLGRYKIRYKR